MKRHSLAVVSIIMMTVCSVRADLSAKLSADWPQYLGPHRDGTSDEKGLLRSWPAGGPKVLWTVKLGAGYGGAAVSGGRVYLLDRIGDKQDVLRCLDLNNGKELWSFAYDARGTLSHKGSRSTPAVDGNYIYACGSFGHVYCFDATTRKPVWNKNVWKDNGGDKVPEWGICQNPLIYGDLLILAAQTPKAGIVAYDKANGSVRWASPALPGALGYVTPIIAKIDGKDQIVMITATTRRERGGRSAPAGGWGDGSDEGGVDGVVLGLDVKDGKTLWTYKGWQCRIPIPQVTDMGDGRLFITGGYMAGSAMIRVRENSGRCDVEELYTTHDFGTHTQPPVMHEGHFYGHCTTNSSRDGLTCLSFDGKLKWKTGESPVFDKGGYVLADGFLLSVDGRDGILYLIGPSADGFKPLASAKLLTAGECWGPVALSDGKLLIRDQKQIRCVAVR